MRRIRIVAHGARADEPTLRQVVHRLRELKCEVVVRPTWEAGDAEVLALEGFDRGADLIVAAGGDGTTNDVLNGLLRADATVPLGIIPLGTANDFAGSAGLPTTPRAIADLLARGAPRPVDVARVEERYFINAATGGFAAEATGTAPAGLKRALGGLAYFLTGVARLSSVDEREIFIEGPGFEWSGSYLGFAVTNARTAGGGHRICPGAMIDDGLLDLVVLPGNTSLIEAAHMAADFKFEPTEDNVRRWRAPWINVLLPEGATLNIDGESRKLRQARFEVFRRGIEVMLPDDCPLIRPPSGVQRMRTVL